MAPPPLLLRSVAVDPIVVDVGAFAIAAGVFDNCSRRAGTPSISFCMMLLSLALGFRFLSLISVVVIVVVDVVLVFFSLPGSHLVCALESPFNSLALPFAKEVDVAGVASSTVADI